MDRSEFESLSRPDVYGRAREEQGVQRGKPLYHDRPWSQVLDEMEDAGARTVGELDAARVAELHRSVSRAAAAQPKSSRSAASGSGTTR